MQMEIKLLKHLNHANIVKYVDAVHATDFLSIVLESVLTSRKCPVLMHVQVRRERLPQRPAWQNPQDYGRR